MIRRRKRLCNGCKADYLRDIRLIVNVIVFSKFPTGDRIEFMSSQPKECALCGGTGWKPVTAAATAADAEKKKSPHVTRCDCRTGARSDLLLAKARIPARYEHCS